MLLSNSFFMRVNSFLKWTTHGSLKLASPTSFCLLQITEKKYGTQKIDQTLDMIKIGIQIFV